MPRRARQRTDEDGTELADKDGTAFRLKRFRRFAQFGATMEATAAVIDLYNDSPAAGRRIVSLLRHERSLGQESMRAAAVMSGSLVNR